MTKLSAVTHNVSIQDDMDTAVNSTYVMTTTEDGNTANMQ